MKGDETTKDLLDKIRGAMAAAGYPIADDTPDEVVLEAAERLHVLIASDHILDQMGE